MSPANYAAAPFAITAKAINDGGLIVRRARKAHACDGSQGLRRHALGCAKTIEPGSFYVECSWNAPAYQSGDRFAAACALALGSEWVRPTGDTKRCPRCGETKDRATGFTHRSNGTVFSWCRDCNRDYRRERAAAKREGS